MNIFKEVERGIDGESESYNVFVYGTLKKGFCNNRCIREGKLIGDGKTIELYAMSDLGAFPAIDITKAISNIKGEVWNVSPDTLFNSLDHLEGYPSFYNRREEVIELESGERVKALMYHLNNPSDYDKHYIHSGFWGGSDFKRDRLTRDNKSKINNNRHRGTIA